MCMCVCSLACLFMRLFTFSLWNVCEEQNNRKMRKKKKRKNEKGKRKKQQTSLSYTNIDCIFVWFLLKFFCFYHSLVVFFFVIFLALLTLQISIFLFVYFVYNQQTYVVGRQFVSFHLIWFRFSDVFLFFILRFLFLLIESLHTCMHLCMYVCMYAWTCLSLTCKAICCCVVIIGKKKI